MIQVGDAVRACKVHVRWGCAPALGMLLRATVPLPDWPVTWVPSTARRRRQRGVDLPQLLAGPQAVRLLRRTVERPDQTALDPAQRRASPAGAFTAVGAVPPDVVLVDDVRTTGATAAAAAGALREGGARRVLVATLAVGGAQARSAAAGTSPARAPVSRW